MSERRGSHSSIARLSVADRAALNAHAQNMLARGATVFPVSKRQAAAHEAGHVVAAHALGSLVRRVRIWQSKASPIGDWTGWTEQERPADWSSGVPARGSVAGLLATPFGLVAESLHVWAGPTMERLLVPEAMSEWNLANDMAEIALADAQCIAGLLLSWLSELEGYVAAIEYRPLLLQVTESLRALFTEHMLMWMRPASQIAEKLECHGRLMRHEIIPLLKDVRPVDVQACLTEALAHHEEIMEARNRQAARVRAHFTTAELAHSGMTQMKTENCIALPDTLRGVILRHHIPEPLVSLAQDLSDGAYREPARKGSAILATRQDLSFG